MRFADPKNDIAFKKIFGDENKTEILISFLNSILDFKDKKLIKKVTILNPYQVPQIKDLKNSIVDIKAINQNNEEFIVEMQVEKDKNFAKRSLYYTSKSYVNQIAKAQEYKKLKKVYFIGILDFAIFDTKDYMSKHLIMDEKTLKQEVKDFEFNFIELKKFNFTLQECDTTAKKWIYFIKNAENFELIPQEYENIKEFRDAFLSAKIFDWNKDELEIYDWVSMQEGIRLSALDTAKSDGIDLGIKQGIKQGLEQGLEQGAKDEKITIAKNLLKAGVDMQTIKLTTGLNTNELKKT
ncbi:MAG: Rpn family recombination-promoting nuclease/putative transposase [Campylobacterota bacterium]|nr:Rpn family recombination-promoting nuclease/putative transposase [Campylobacterota bacterium]